MTTELAIIENEADVIEPLSKSEARALDKKLRAASNRTLASIDKAEANFDTLMELVDQAQRGEIHRGMGAKSWTAYIKDAVPIIAIDSQRRKALVAYLSGKGMSQRAIAGTLGVSKGTVQNDQGGQTCPPDFEPSKVLGLDNKTYPQRKPDEPELEPPLDVEYEEQPEEPDEAADEEPEEEPMKAVKIVDEFDRETCNLVNAASVMRDLRRESLWSKATNRITKANLAHLRDVAALVQELVGELEQDT